MKSLSCKSILAGKAPANEPVVLRGWVRTRRDSKAGLSFVHVSDGSCFHPVQVVATNTLANYATEVVHLTAGCAIEAVGTIVPSPAKGQPFESKDPGFTTNNPSRYYWDVANEQYHFETEGGTNGYAFLPVEIDNDPFTLEYDINISSIEEDGAVRFGITGTDMDISKAANILGIFEHGQDGRLMGLQVIDQNNHFYETKSLHGSYCGEQRDCETKLFKENVTYHVEIRYNKQLRQADIKVIEKRSGGLAWGFYVPLGQDLHSWVA